MNRMSYGILVQTSSLPNSFRSGKSQLLIDESSNSMRLSPWQTLIEKPAEPLGNLSCVDWCMMNWTIFKVRNHGSFLDCNHLAVCWSTAQSSHERLTISAYAFDPCTPAEMVILSAWDRKRLDVQPSRSKPKSKPPIFDTEKHWPSIVAQFRSHDMSKKCSTKKVCKYMILMIRHPYIHSW